MIFGQLSRHLLYCSDELLGYLSNNKAFPFFRPEEIKGTSLDDRELLLDFETVTLGSCPHTTLVLTNTSAIRARFSLELEYFRAAKPLSPPDGECTVGLTSRSSAKLIRHQIHGMTGVIETIQISIEKMQHQLFN